MRKQVVIFIAVIALIIFTGCTNQNENTSGNVSLKQTESTANAAPQSSTEQKVSSNKVDELKSENEALKALQVALDGMQSTANISFHSFSQTLSHTYNWDNPSTTIESYYRSDSYGEMQRNPAMAHTRNYSTSGSSEMMDGEIVKEIDTNSDSSDYYISKEYGLFYRYDSDDSSQLHRGEDLSDEFRTIEHLEELIELFMQYPDQLVISTIDAEEVYEGYSDEDFYSVFLNLTNDQYWDLIPYINSNFLTGTYDVSRFDDQTFTFIERELINYQISLLLNGDYNLEQFFASYKGRSLDGKENEDYEKILLTSFYDFNTTEVPAVPE